MSEFESILPFGFPEFLGEMGVTSKEEEEKEGSTFGKMIPPTHSEMREVAVTSLLRADDTSSKRPERSSSAKVRSYETTAAISYRSISRMRDDKPTAIFRREGTSAKFPREKAEAVVRLHGSNVAIKERLSFSRLRSYASSDILKSHSTSSALETIDTASELHDYSTFAHYYDWKS